MMKNIIKSFALILALIVAMTLSVSVLAEGEDSAASSEAVSTEAVSDGTESSDASSEAASSDASSEAASSDASSEAASSDASSVVSATESDSTSTTVSDSTANDSAAAETASDFPWARVITLSVIVILIVVAWVLTKTNTAIGQKLKKFFKEYWSEIKKVSWTSPKDTAKATGVVLGFLVVAAIAIGVLDLAFTQLIKLIAEIFN